MLGAARAMPVFRITCPKCLATASGIAARPLPAGKPIKCPRCQTVFRIPAARPPAARPATGKRVIFRITCPACKIVLKTAAPPPPGKGVLCPRCRTAFVTKPRTTRLVGPPVSRETKVSRPLPPRPKPTKLGSDPKRPKETKLSGAPSGSNGRPVVVLRCPACAAVMRITGKLPPGKTFPCPRCRRPVPLLGKRPLPAKKTALGRPVRRTTLTPARPKTRLASPPALLPAGSLLRCPHCTTAFKGPKAMPVGRLLKCSKCAQLFRAAAPPRPKTAERKPTRPRPTVAPPRKHSHAGIYLLMGLALAAILVIGLGYFDVIPLFPRYRIPDSAWREFVPPEGRCRIEMPGVPQALRVRARGPGGIEAEKFVVIRKREDAAFFLAISDRSARARASLAEVYAAERDAVVSVAKGDLAGEKEIVRDGQRGKEFQIDFPDGAMLIEQVFLVRGADGGSRAYVLAATGALLGTDESMAARFFGSFHIDPPVGSPPQ